MSGELLKKVLAALFFSIISTFGIAQQENDIRVLAYYLGNPNELDNYNVNQFTHIIFCFGQLDGNRLTFNSF